MGPMRAARTFLLALEAHNLLAPTVEVHADLYGSLALTGAGHGTDRAVILGLLGEEASKLDPDTIDQQVESIRLSVDGSRSSAATSFPFARRSTSSFIATR